MSSLPHRSFPSPLRLLCSAALLTLPIAAQCGLQLVPDPVGPGGTVGKLHPLATGGVAAVLGGTALMRWSDPGWSAIAAPAGAFLIGRTLAANDGSFLVGDLIGSRFLRYDGATWSTAASAPPAMVVTAAAGFELPNGDLVVETPYTILDGLARWDGSSWTSLAAGFDAAPHLLGVLANGDVVVAGAFTIAGGVPANGIARWDGSAWSTYGSGIAGFPPNTAFRNVAEAPTGELFAVVGNVLGGRSEIAVWDGVSWTSFGAPPFWGTLSSMSVLPDGDVLIAGVLHYVGSVNTLASNPMRSDGGPWQSFGSGIGPWPGYVNSTCELPDGRIALGGQFTLADGQSSPSFALLESSCPATAVANGSGCAGSAGPLSLIPEALPWLGGTAAARVDGLAAGAVAFGVLGLQSSSVPLVQIHPAAAAGCQLLAVPIVGELLAGARLEVEVPDDPGLVGVVVHAQVLQAEFGGGSLALLSSTNAVVLQVGNL